MGRLAKSTKFAPTFLATMGRQGTPPPLVDLCVRTLKRHCGAIGDLGSAPVALLLPVLDACTVEQLENVEKLNPGIVQETTPLWRKFCASDGTLGHATNWRAHFKIEKALRKSKLRRAGEKIRARNAEEEGKHHRIVLLEGPPAKTGKQKAGALKLLAPKPTSVIGKLRAKQVAKERKAMETKQALHRAAKFSRAAMFAAHQNESKRTGPRGPASGPPQAARPGPVLLSQGRGGGGSVRLVADGPSKSMPRAPLQYPALSARTSSSKLVPTVKGGGLDLAKVASTATKRPGAEAPGSVKRAAVANGASSVNAAARGTVGASPRRPQSKAARHQDPPTTHLQRGKHANVA